MKLRVIDRILFALIGLLLLCAAAAVCAEAFWQVPVSAVIQRWLQNQGQYRRLITVAGVAVIALLGLYSFLTLFRRPKKDRDYIAQNTDEGELSISFSAVESLVARCLGCQSELTVDSTKISSGKDGLVIDLKGTVGTGVNMPLVVSSVQKELRQYVTSCTGLEVDEVRVKVAATDGSKAGGAYAIADPQPLPGTPGAADAQSSAGHQRVFSRPDEPVSIPLPPPTPAEAPEEPSRPALDMEEVLDALDAEDAATAAERGKAPAADEEEQEAHHQRIFGHMEEPVIGPDPAPGQAEEIVEKAEAALEETAEAAEETTEEAIAEAAEAPAAEAGEALAEAADAFDEAEVPAEEAAEDAAEAVEGIEDEAEAVAETIEDKAEDAAEEASESPAFHWPEG
ncbi:MAG: alkaline shock response membrane anchor protein AmaP [Clostridia bacterium]|nr:alkaline shock response membrane anchor protein AmaP [Clostridia bacterium]